MKHVQLVWLGLFPYVVQSVVLEASKNFDAKVSSTDLPRADQNSSATVTQHEPVGWWHRLQKNYSVALIDLRASSVGLLNVGALSEKGKAFLSSRAAVVSFQPTSLAACWESFTKSLTMILATELGDKTFFIAAILSMKHSAVAVFTGAIAALAVMTVGGVAVGSAASIFLSLKVLHCLAICLFTYFGLKLLHEGIMMWLANEGAGASEELKEVEEELGVEAASKKGISATVISVFWQSLSLTFAAEWGDRSQIATVALAAERPSPADGAAVIVGALIGHSMCTGLACAGGKALAGKISERTMLIVGGLIFLACAVHATYTECVG